MRIIAGKFRRRKLLASAGLTTRPITDRVKETLFERLSQDVENRRVVDVFAGTGTIGLEALSRGAASAVFVENDRRAFDLLVQNVKTLAVEQQSLCWRTDAMRCSFHPKGVPELLPFELIFFDPPFRKVDAMEGGGVLYKALERLARDSVSSEGALLVFRTPQQVRPVVPDAWQPEAEWEFGGMGVHVFRKQGSSSPAETSGHGGE